jgi:holo-[acyl-carrier protein] synthase
MTINSPLAALQSVWYASVDTSNPTSAIGIDLVEVEPLRQLLDAGGLSFLAAAWTNRERRDANGQPEALAGKWAAKEAVMKALQRGIGEIDPKDVEIISSPSGAPNVELHRAARSIAKRRRVTTWRISVTHEGGWAAAIAFGSGSEHHRKTDGEGRKVG